MCDQLACKSALEQLSVDGVPPDNCFDAFWAGFGSLFGRFLGMYSRFAPDLRDQLGANRRLNNCQLIGCRLAIVSAVSGQLFGNLFGRFFWAVPLLSCRTKIKRCCKSLRLGLRVSGVRNCQLTGCGLTVVLGMDLETKRLNFRRIRCTCRW